MVKVQRDTDKADEKHRKSLNSPPGGSVLPSAGHRLQVDESLKHQKNIHF